MFIIQLDNSNDVLIGVLSWPHSITYAECFIFAKRTKIARLFINESEKGGSKGSYRLTDMVFLDSEAPWKV